MDWTPEGRIKAMAYHRIMTSSEDAHRESVAPLSFASLRTALLSWGVLKPKKG